MALFSKSKGGAKEKDTLLKLLAFIVAGTQGAAAHAVVPNVLAEKIEKLEPGLIAKQTGAEVDPAGNIAVYATSKGVAAVGGDGAAAPSQPAAASPSPYALETGIEMPVSKRGGAKSSLYPFEQMAVGQSFFVPATAEKENPAKALASTCSSASKRYVKTGRKFVVRKITVDGKVTGARCFCIAPEAAA